MIHFSTLKGKSIMDVNGRVVGPLIDFTILPDGKFARITSFVTKINGERRKIPQNFVVKYDKQIHLNCPFAKIPILKEDETEFSLVNNVLDMQIVDTEGLKVVRVNDILLSLRDGALSVTSVDVGFKGFLRRMGLEKFSIVKKIKDQIIPWEFVAPLELKTKKIQLNIPKTKL
jgi:magnesium transporter